MIRELSREKNHMAVLQGPWISRAVPGRRRGEQGMCAPRSFPPRLLPEFFFSKHLRGPTAPFPLWPPCFEILAPKNHAQRSNDPSTQTPSPNLRPTALAPAARSAARPSRLKLVTAAGIEPESHRLAVAKGLACARASFQLLAGSVGAGKDHAGASVACRDPFRRWGAFPTVAEATALRTCSFWSGEGRMPRISLIPRFPWPAAAIPTRPRLRQGTRAASRFDPGGAILVALGGALAQRFRRLGLIVGGPRIVSAGRRATPTRKRPPARARALTPASSTFATRRTTSPRPRHQPFRQDEAKAHEASRPRNSLARTASSAMGAPLIMVTRQRAMTGTVCCSRAKIQHPAPDGDGFRLRNLAREEIAPGVEGPQKICLAGGRVEGKRRPICCVRADTNCPKTASNRTATRYGRPGNGPRRATGQTTGHAGLRPEWKAAEEERAIPGWTVASGQDARPGRDLAAPPARGGFGLGKCQKFPREKNA